MDIQYEMALRAYGESCLGLFAMWDIQGLTTDEAIVWPGPVAGGDGSSLVVKHE